MHRTPEPATRRFVRGMLDEGDTLPFALEEPTQPSTPYDRVDVELEVDLGTAPAPKYPPARELQLSASKNLVMDTVQFAKVDRDPDRDPDRDNVAPQAKKPAPTTKKMTARPAPKQVRAATAVTRTTAKMRAQSGPSALAMIVAFVLGAMAFLTGLGLARLMI